jgi:hypothetical protein
MAPTDVYYFLGRGYLINYEFKKALDAFETFKSKQVKGDISQYDLEAYINNCENGLQLSQQRKNVVITSTKEVNKESFYKNYDFNKSTGKIIRAAPEFITSKDNASSNEPVMYISNDRNLIFSQVTERREKEEKEINILKRSPNNVWTAPDNISYIVNSERDEDYPFLDRMDTHFIFRAKATIV